MISSRLPKRLVCSLLSLQIALAPTMAWPQPQSNETAASEDYSEFQSDTQLNYWGKLDLEQPDIAEFALGEPISEAPLWKVDPQSSLVDQDPFFMRAQKWETSTNDNSCTADSVCFRKEGTELVLAGVSGSNSLRLQQNFTPLLETEAFIFLAADTDAIFRAKNPGDKNPGEGIFFIRKSELAANARKNFPVPVFFFPLPDEGWTGSNKPALELLIHDQVVFHDKNGVALPIDMRDIETIEKSQRDNMILAQAWSFLEGRVEANGVAYPKAGATVAFGLILSGVLPEVVKKGASSLDLEKMKGLARHLSLVPEAFAEENKPSLLTRVRAGIKARVEKLDPEYWKKWIFPTVAYGGTLAAAGMLYSTYPIDWSTMITEDMPERLTKLAGILGSVTAASVLMKYTVHKTKIDKMYPRAANETWLQKVNREHKGILTEVAVGLYFSLASIPQGIRHILEFMKDHFMPSNQMLHKAWEATMGFQMKQNSHLAINWKTFYLGAIIFGMADSILVGVDLLIFTPFLLDYFNWTTTMGAAAASFASAEVLRNFLGYIQGGAHGYSAEMKMIHMLSAEKEAKRQVQLRGMDPEAMRSRDEVQALTEAELDKRFKAVGLPGQNEFLYDPISVIEGTAAKIGFSVPPEEITPSQKEYLAKQRFVLTKRHWGLVGPTLQRALEAARKAQMESPSETGAKTVELLEWAISDRSHTKAVAGQAWTLTQAFGRADLDASIQKEVSAWQAKTQNPTRIGMAYAALKGSLKYLALEGTHDVRDIRRVIWLASTNGAIEPLAQFLPQSWIEKAGSREAALLGAELIHRAFFSYYEGKPELIQPSRELINQYSARASAIIARLMIKEPALADPFVRKVRHSQLMYRLKEKDRLRAQIANFQPPPEKGLAGKQWEVARSEGQRLLAETTVDDQVHAEWLNMAAKFGAMSGLEDRLDQGLWTKTYRYRLAVARAFSKQVGLSVLGAEDSEFVRMVTAKAAIDAEGELALPNEVAYLAKLSPEDRAFHEAQIFTKHFISNYIDNSVHTDEHLKAASSEFPGRFQTVRKMMDGKKGGKALRKTLNVFESLFRNEETSYQPGFWSAVDRNVPILPDFYHNFVRNLRAWPYILSISYLTSYYIWQIKMPYSLWAFFISVGFVGTAFIEMNNRLQRFWDAKPMGDVPSKLTYSFIHSRLTNPEVMLLQAYADDITGGFEKYVTTPVKETLKDCAQLLNGGR